MTVKQFRDEVCDWADYIAFCESNDFCDITDYIYCGDNANDYTNDRTYELVRNNDWEEVRSYLDSLPEHFDICKHYRRDDWDNWYELDDRDFMEEIETFIKEHEDFFDIDDEFEEASVILV